MRYLVLLCSTVWLLQAESISNSIGMEFVKIPSGSFMMGRDANFEYGYSNELPQHRKHIRSFYIQTTEVTQAQWVKVMGSNPSQFKGRNNPVERVSWHDAKAFVRKLNQMEGTNRYRLPTEAEWEYAARAGTTTTYHFGDDKGSLGIYAWYDGNSGSRTHPVGKKRPNRWGLYDMHGNVWEWTSSCYTKNYNTTSCDRYDGVVARVLRGGSWDWDAVFLRVAYRDNYRPGDRGNYGGFRLARNLH